jgi:hypothetical protein
MYKMQFIASINIKEHLVNPERIWEAVHCTENARAFEFKTSWLSTSTS